MVEPEQELTWTGVSTGVRAVHRNVLRELPGGQVHLLTEESMDWFENSYSGPKGDWRYSPLLKGCEGLPPTLVTTAGLDPIRDQGRAYAARCTEAGVETIYLEAEGTIHGFLNLRKGIPSAQDDLARCLAYLKTWVRHHAAEPRGQGLRRGAHR